MKASTIVIPGEYIDINNNLLKTIMTARDKKNNLYVICNTREGNMIIEEQDLFENYDIALNGKRIETPEDDINRDEEFDVFKSFQENAKKAAEIISLKSV